MTPVLQLLVVVAALATQPDSTPQTSACAFAGEPVVLRQSGNAILQAWTVVETEALASAALPADTAYLEYRRAMERAGADRRRPVADAPRPANESERQLWRREAQNAELAYSGRAGRLRPVQCLDALLFAYQNARYPELSHPTEFLASILRQGVKGQRVLKIYFAASDQVFPPKDYYGFDEIKEDLAADWEFWTVLHNHTVQQNQGVPALGVPAPSTSDVDLLRSLASGLALQNAWITNGFFTLEIPARMLDQYVGRR